MKNLWYRQEVLPQDRATALAKPKEVHWQVVNQTLLEVFNILKWLPNAD